MRYLTHAILLAIFLSSGSNRGVAAPSLRSTDKGLQTTDVALHVGGVLVGQLVNNQGQPKAAAEVLVTDGPKKWRTQTDRQGRFQIAGLKSSVYQVHSAGNSRQVRCWLPSTAPPAATRGLLLVERSNVVRAQRGGDPRYNRPLERAKKWLADPLIFGGVVTTAVAIPVALHNAEQDKPPASP